MQAPFIYPNTLYATPIPDKQQYLGKLPLEIREPYKYNTLLMETRTSPGIYRKFGAFFIREGYGYFRPILWESGG